MEKMEQTIVLKSKKDDPAIKKKKVINFIISNTRKCAL